MNKTSQIVSKGGLRQGQWTQWLISLAIIIFAVSGWAWWHKVRSNPERVLYGSIENSLRTRSVTRKASYMNSDQIMEVAVSPELKSRALTTQSSDTGTGKTTVQTEAINTHEAEFVRWTKIETDQKNKKGEQLNFDDLLNVWGKSPADQTGQLSQLHLTLLSGVVPVGNFSAHDRQALMRIIRDDKVYTFDQSKVERRLEKGRPVYVYDAEVNPVAFYKFAKQYGEITNIAQLKSLDPAQFQDVPAESFKLTVDVWSQHITTITDATGGSELLSGYGRTGEITTPKESIPLEELQAKLQAVQE